METNKKRIIVALDVDSLDGAKSFVEKLIEHVGFFKIGLQLMTAVGAPQIVEWFKKNNFGDGSQIFLDGKFNDIPNTVVGASKAAAKLGVGMFNVHASSGIEAMRAAVKATEEHKTFPESKGPIVLAVTVLTSLDEENVHLIFGAPSKAKVIQFARNAVTAGMHGVICSPKELEILGKQQEFRDLLKVTPGIRPEWAVAGDQKRIMTPGDAIKAGADYLVIGRPITKPPTEIGNSTDAAQRIVEEIERALSKKEES